MIYTTREIRLFARYYILYRCSVGETLKRSYLRFKRYADDDRMDHDWRSRRPFWAVLFLIRFLCHRISIGRPVRRRVDGRCQGDRDGYSRESDTNWFLQHARRGTGNNILLYTYIMLYLLNIILLLLRPDIGLTRGGLAPTSNLNQVLTKKKILFHVISSMCGIINNYTHYYLHYIDSIE